MFKKVMAEGFFSQEPGRAPQRFGFGGEDACGEQPPPQPGAGGPSGQQIRALF